MTTAPVIWDLQDPIIARIEDQINWYDAKSSKCQKTYKRIKVIEIIAAALIPFLSALHISDVTPQPFTLAHIPLTIGTVTALLGVLITILEGVLQLNQYQQIWVTYRATCEALKHEKFTYIAKGGSLRCARRCPCPAGRARRNRRLSREQQVGLAAATTKGRQGWRIRVVSAYNFCDVA